MESRMNPTRTARVAGFTMLSLGLSACGHVPVSTLYKLWSFDMATADPAFLRAAVRTSSGLRPRPDGVTLTVTASRDGDKDKTVHTLVLQEIKDPAELAGLAAFQKTGTHIAAYRLSQSDSASVRQLQAALRGPSGKSPGTGQASIGIGAQACRQGPLLAGPILTSTYFNAGGSDGYLPVLVDVDLRQELDAKSLAESIPQCGAP
jgi:hypothetical protein